VLTVPEIEAHLARLSYRPGWSWELHVDEWEGPYVRFLVDVEDTYQPGSVTTLGINSWLPPMESTLQLERWMWWRLDRIERHECREFLKRDGTVIFNPHATENGGKANRPFLQRARRNLERLTR
jgi:hypothetical protein